MATRIDIDATPAIRDIKQRLTQVEQSASSQAMITQQAAGDANIAAQAAIVALPNLQGQLDTKAALSTVQGYYLSRAAAIAAFISPLVNKLQLGGYAAANDGGRADYKRVSSIPNHPGYFVSADGGIWEIVPDVVGPNVRQTGALGTAVNNTFAVAPTPKWTGPDDTAAFVALEQVCVALGVRARYVPAGRYLLNAQAVSDLAVSSGEVIWYGDGDLTRIIDGRTPGVGNQGLFAYRGGLDGPTVTTIFLTSDIVPGQSIIPINNASLGGGLRENQWIMLVDKSQTAFENSFPSDVAISNIGFVAQIKSIDIPGNTITLTKGAEMALTAGGGTHTVARRWSTPCRNVTFRNLCFEGDQNRGTSTASDHIIRLTAAIGVRMENLKFNLIQCNEVTFSDCIDVDINRHISFRDINTDATRSYTISLSTTHHSRVSNSYGVGGRHFVDCRAAGWQSTTATIEAAHNTISNCVSDGAYFAAFATHPGGRNWDWFNCVARNMAGEDSGAATAGFLVRGRAQRFVGCSVINFSSAFYFAFGSDSTIEGGEIRDCGLPLRVNIHPGVYIRGLRVVNPRTKHILKIDRNTRAGIDIQAELIGAPTEATVNNLTVAVPADWKINIPATSGLPYYATGNEPNPTTGVPDPAFPRSAIPASQTLKPITANRENPLSLTAAATDLASVVALANSLRSALIGLA